MQLSNFVLPTKLSATPVFRTVVAKVFAKFDTNNDGTLDPNELTVAMCHVHYKLARHSPGLTEPPTSESISKLLKKHDKDSSSTLTEDEFFDMAVEWFDQGGAMFIEQMLLTSLVSMVVLPGSASIMHDKVPLAKYIPRILFKVLFGVALKLVATNISMARKASE